MPKGPPNKKLKQTDLLSSFQRSRVGHVTYLSHSLCLDTALALGLVGIETFFSFRKSRLPEMMNLGRRHIMLR